MSEVSTSTWFQQLEVLDLKADADQVDDRLVTELERHGLLERLLVLRLPRLNHISDAMLENLDTASVTCIFD